MILAKLGLRASDVAALNLDEIDGQSGTILVHGKGSCRYATMSAQLSSLIFGMGDQLRRVVGYFCEHSRRVSILPPAAPSR